MATKRLIKNGQVNWDKVHTENELKKLAFEKLECIEDLMEDLEIKSMKELHFLLLYATRLRDLDAFLKIEQERLEKEKKI